MRELTKPRALRVGSLIGIVSPASLANAEAVARGVATLEGMGFRTRLFSHALDRGPLNYAGTLEARLSDFHAAFADAEVDAVFCTRGGWGAAELLPHLDRELIRANPKAFVGYSDVTSLHVWLAREAGLVSFQGPMVASDFSKEPGPDMASFARALQGTEAWTLDAASGLRVLRPGRAEGALTGGCVSIYVEALGTPYAAEPPAGVLFLEDVGVKPYQWDRMLVHLRQAGMLERVTGIVFGDMGQCVDWAGQPPLEEQLLYALREFVGPIGIGLRSGHVEGGNITLPWGVGVELDLRDKRNPRMHFAEASVLA